MSEHATPLPAMPVLPDSDDPPEPNHDQMHQNNCPLIHNLLYVAEVTLRDFQW